MPEKITATYRIVTPMFIGDAEQNATGISPASVKGALRFWWRALNWGRVLNAPDGANGDEAVALQNLHAQEAALFGGLPEADKDGQSKGGQGKFLLRVVSDTINPPLTANELNNAYNLKTAPWHSYLLGLGLMKYENHANHYQRSAIVSGSFSVELYCKNTHHLKELETLLLLWGLLGGLGSRQRKGFGSVSITELKVGDTNIQLPENRQQYLDMLQRIIDKSAEPEPPYTAFSRSTKILCSPSNSNTPWQKLGDIAKKMQIFRGWGFSRNGGEHLINGVAANHSAYSCKQADHDVVYQYLDRTPSTQLPKSYIFGLPRSYNLSTTPRRELKLDVSAIDSTNGKNDTNKRSRRASPLFIHVHQFPNNESMIIQSFLPATFLPSQDIVQVKQKIGDNWRDITDIPVNAVTDWQVINEYLNLFSDWQEV